MPALYEIRYLPDGPTQKFSGSRGNYYEFPDGSRLDLYSTAVWCRQCNKVTHGEELVDCARIDKEIADQLRLAEEVREEIAAGCAVDPKAEGQTYFLKRVEDLRRRRAWRVSRVSPPKCLLCGSTDLITPECGVPFSNPAGRGQIVIDVIGFCSTKFNEWFFTPEGDRIPRDTKPMYWRFRGHTTGETGLP